MNTMFKINIPALLLAILVFVAGNGIAVFEHICNTSRSHNYSLFVKRTCEMEKPLAACCARKAGIVQKKGCCEHKQVFSKLNIHGFTAKQLQIKPLEKQINLNFLAVGSFHYSKQLFESYYSGLPPPDNLFLIKNLLQPSPVGLQNFRC
jgi:hypothetical protein